MLLQIELTGDQEKAFLFMVSERNKNLQRSYTPQEIFEQLANFYIKQSLKSILPIAIAEEKLAKLNDEQQLELYSKTLNSLDSFVDSIELDTVPENPSFIRNFLNWFKSK